MTINPDLAARLDDLELREVMGYVTKRRVAEGKCKRKKLAACIGCSLLLGGRERRKPCPKCGVVNPH